MWYLCFLPIIVARSSLIREHWKLGCVLLVSWIGAQGLWLSQAYKLEHLGVDTFKELHFAGLLFYLIQTWILGQIMTNS